MLTGIVSVGLQPKVDLEVLGPSGGSHFVELVIDTGFDGELILPSTLIGALGLAFAGTYYANLADGRRTVLNYHEAIVVWHGRHRRVEVLDSGGVALLGMGLLQGSRLFLDAAPGGAVEIEEIP